MSLIKLVFPDGTFYDIVARPEQTLAQAVYLSGLLQSPPLCSGLGSCGHCLMQPELGISVSKLTAKLPQNAKEKEIISPELLEQGWRLGCKITVAQLEEILKDTQQVSDEKDTPSNINVSNVSLLQKNSVVVNLPNNVKKLLQVQVQYSVKKAKRLLAVDFGSTSIHSQILDLKTLDSLSLETEGTGNLPESAANKTEKAISIEVNPQMGTGTDIMSRLALALSSDGLQQLSTLSQGVLRRLCEKTEVQELVLAANPAMTYLTLGLPVRGLAHAPYSLSYRGGCLEQLAGLPPIWVAPLISPFIGGDVSAGYASLDLDPDLGKREYPFLLVDMGTNGEFLLALDGHTALATSLPLGPALEGIGMSCGTEARPGAITEIELSPFGLTPVLYGNSASSSGSINSETVRENYTHGSGCPCCQGKIEKPDGQYEAGGISGTGYLSLFKLLREFGIMNEDGHFASPTNNKTFTIKNSSLSKKLMGMLRQDNKGIQCFYLTEKLYASASDVEELLKIKASFSLAYKSLLAQAGVNTRALKGIYIAGSLGLHSNLDALISLGFLPALARPLLKAVGNSSLSGARLLLKNPALRTPLVEWSEKVTTLSLTDSSSFQESFASEMKFSF